MPEQTLYLNSIIDLADFRGVNAGLTWEQKRFAADMAFNLIDSLYAHLPLKKAMYAVDPVQDLMLLRKRLLSQDMEETKFHQEMIRIFNSVRDLHTNYMLPEPFKSSVAFLPFTVEEYFENGIPHYVVTKVAPGVNRFTFSLGVEITHWNGIPMKTGVDQNASAHAGSNPAARHLQGLRLLTVRPLAFSPLPLEDWVTITYVHQEGIAEARFPWKVFRPEPIPNVVNPNDKSSVAASSLGLDLAQEIMHRGRQQLFTPETIQLERQMLSMAATNLGMLTPAFSEDISKNFTFFPNKLIWGPMNTPSGLFGYLRIRSFDVVDVEGFVNEVIRILTLLPQNGLILDVRSNPGGNILAGEYLLQLFTDKKIQAEPMELRNTSQTLKYTQNPLLKQWGPSVELSVETGELFSQGFPLEPIDNVNSIGVNSIGRKYFGKVVLLTDAACYSTTDIFCAGFQDHEIGPILGFDETTGAGGANVWTYELLRQYFLVSGNLPPTQSLPLGMDMRIAFRRSKRVGSRAGLPLEDLGVTCDQVHQITKRDIFQNNADLMEKAGLLLAHLIRGGSLES